MTRILALVVVVVGLLAGGAGAEERSALLPEVPLATGEPHPEGNEFWRKNHMDLLRHDRDLTLREGLRDVDASLSGCVTCHAVPDAEGTPIPYENGEFFCRVCHDFVSVKIDCFVCHSSTPPEDSDLNLALTPASDTDENSISAYLKRLQQAGTGSEDAEASQ